MWNILQTSRYLEIIYINICILIIPVDSIFKIYAYICIIYMCVYVCMYVCLCV